jgi:hypothetical protein
MRPNRHGVDGSWHWAGSFFVSRRRRGGATVNAAVPPPCGRRRPCSRSAASRRPSSSCARANSWRRRSATWGRGRPRSVCTRRTTSAMRREPFPRAARRTGAAPGLPARVPCGAVHAPIPARSRHVPGPLPHLNFHLFRPRQGKALIPGKVDECPRIGVLLVAVLQAVADGVEPEGVCPHVLRQRPEPTRGHHNQKPRRGAVYPHAPLGQVAQAHPLGSRILLTALGLSHEGDEPLYGMCLNLPQRRAGGACLAHHRGGARQLGLWTAPEQRGHTFDQRRVARAQRPRRRRGLQVPGVDRAKASRLDEGELPPRVRRQGVLHSKACLSRSQTGQPRVRSAATTSNPIPATDGDSAPRLPPELRKGSICRDGALRVRAALPPTAYC